MSNITPIEWFAIAAVIVGLYVVYRLAFSEGVNYQRWRQECDEYNEQLVTDEAEQELHELTRQAFIAMAERAEQDR